MDILKHISLVLMPKKQQKGSRNCRKLTIKQNLLVEHLVFLILPRKPPTSNLSLMLKAPHLVIVQIEMPTRRKNQLVLYLEESLIGLSPIEYWKAHENAWL
jgi:hypothetical protein